MSCNEVVDSVQNDRQKLAKENTSLGTLSRKSPLDAITQSVHDAMSSLGAAKIGASPLGQMGTDFLSDQISKNGKQIIDNATGIATREIGKIAHFDVRKTIADAQKQIFNAIAAALTANNDLSLIFLQRVAQNTVDALNAKRAILLSLKANVTALHNALRILVAGQPLFNAYLVKLRQALTDLVGAKKNVDTVTNTYVATKRFLPRQFADAKQQMEDAYDLISPAKQQPNLKIIGSELLQSVGLPSSSEQLTSLIAVPQLAQQVAYTASGYFIATLKVNALLLAFTFGYDNFKKSSSGLLNNYSIDMLRSLSSKIQALIERMATDLNGNSAALVTTDYAKSPISGIVSSVTPDYIDVGTSRVVLKPTSFPTVAPGDKVFLGQQLAKYSPGSIIVACKSLGWLIELRAIIDYSGLVPGSTLNSIQVSNDALSTYLAAVVDIKKHNTRTGNGAILVATEGREDLSDLDSQIQTLCLKSVRAIIDADVAKGVTALAKTVLNRLDLSLVQDAEITADLQKFINAPVSLKTTLPDLAGSIRKALRNAGMDRAADLLEKGDFGSFFNMNPKTATYVGAALVGIATLKQCLTTDEDRAQLTNAERVLQRDQKAKEMLAQRSATSGFAQQVITNQQTDAKLATIQTQAQTACGKCGLPEDFSPLRLLTAVNKAMGIQALGNVTLPAALANIGKGFI